MPVRPGYRAWLSDAWLLSSVINLRPLAKRLGGHAIAMLVLGVLFSVFVLAVTASRYQQSEAKALGLSAQEYVRQVLDTFVIAWGGITIVWLIGSAILEYKHLEYPGDKKDPDGGDHY